MRQLSLVECTTLPIFTGMAYVAAILLMHMQNEEVIVITHLAGIKCVCAVIMLRIAT